MREAVVPYDCADCGPGATATFGEDVFGGRLHWSLWHACATGQVQECGHDEPPADLRRALLDQCGTYRLRLTAGPRLAVMKVLRDRGVPLRETPAAVAELQGPGWPGTEMELRLLAGHLTTAGATVLRAGPCAASTGTASPRSIRAGSYAP